MTVIDLHAHSSASDGTDTPADLVAAASRAGVDTLALTDHDTVQGWSQAARAAASHGVTLVRGVEVSARWRGVSVHVLGYLPDPSHPELAAELERTRTSRLTRMDRMVALMSEAGLPVDIDRVRAELTPGATLGRPHLADALVREGVVDDRDEAFARYLHSEGPFYIAHYAPEAARAVEVVRAAGGVAVLAHPRARLRGRVLPTSAIHDLVDAGLAGLEVDHRDNAPDDRDLLRELARDRGVLVTGSSDYHGSGKANRLAEHTTALAVLDALVAGATSPVKVLHP